MPVIVSYHFFYPLSKFPLISHLPCSPLQSGKVIMLTSVTPDSMCYIAPTKTKTLSYHKTPSHVLRNEIPYI